MRGRGSHVEVSGLRWRGVISRGGEPPVVSHKQASTKDLSRCEIQIIKSIYKQAAVPPRHPFLSAFDVCVYIYSRNRPTPIYDNNCRCEGAGGGPRRAPRAAPPRSTGGGEADDEVRRPAYEALGGRGVVRGAFSAVVCRLVRGTSVAGRVVVAPPKKPRWGRRKGSGERGQEE